MVPIVLDSLKALSKFPDFNAPYKLSVLAALAALVLAVVALILCAVNSRVGALGAGVASIALNVLSTAAQVVGDKSSYPVDFSLPDELRFLLLGQGLDGYGQTAFYPSLVLGDLIAVLLLVVAILVTATADKETIVGAPATESSTTFYAPPGSTDAAAIRSVVDEGDQV